MLEESLYHFNPRFSRFPRFFLYVDFIWHFKANLRWGWIFSDISLYASYWFAALLFTYLLAGITGTPETGKTKLAKASLGSEHTLPWCYVRNTTECIKELKSKGTKVCFTLIVNIVYCLTNKQFIALEQTKASQLLSTTLATIPTSLLETNPISLPSSVLLYLFLLFFVRMFGRRKRGRGNEQRYIGAYGLGLPFADERYEPRDMDTQF